MADQVTTLRPANESHGQRIEREKREEYQKGVAVGEANVAAAIANAARVAVKEAITPLRDQFDAAVTELRSFHVSHMREARKGAYWRGFAVGGVVLFAVVCGTGYWAWRDAQFVAAAGSAMVQRGGQDVLPAPRVCTPGLDEDCLPDTVSRDSGYERPGREPASAGR